MRNAKCVFRKYGPRCCFYDLQLCEQSELCFNDSLFGTCVTQLSDAINYSDLEPEALGEAAQVLQYLIETGYKWHDSYTQCVVGKFLQSAVTHQRYDPDVCEYLKALLDVIDQNKGGPHGAVDQLPDQAAVAPVDMAPPPPPPPSSSQIGSGSLSEVADPRSAHGEFLTQADMSSDFEQSDQEPLPIEPMLSVSSNQDQNPQQEPSSFDFQQYLRAYQEALQQQQPQTRDLVSSAVEKKSDPSVPVIATTTATPVEATTSASSSFLAQLNNSAADEAENIQAMRALLALINQYVPSAGDGQATPTSRDQQEMTIGIPIPPQSQEISPEVFEQILRQQQQQQAPSENFQLSGDYPPYPVEDVYVPDFTAIPPPEILQDMLLRSARAQLQSSPRISLADLFIAEQLFGPPPQQQQQQSMIVDPRMLMDPRSRRMDPQMMQQQQQQQQFDRFDPRILMELQQQMDPRMLRQQQMDPRMLMGLQQQQQQLDPRMFMEDQQQQQVDPRMFMDPRMAMMGDPSWMMQQQQQQPMTDPRAVFSQGFGMNQNMMMSPWMQGPQGRMMDNGPFDLEMPMKRGGGDFAPFAGLNNGMSQPPYMMQQGGPDPRMMMMLDPRMQSLYAPPPYGFFPQNLAQEWRPPMALPKASPVDSRSGRLLK
ncbi:hypothetical protein BV898_19002 [Hypsibius exemplaris]|uniref:Uncharacterized protein n=1 Tax=Hypsibius exemplaris TaxID=2072580 RepID=A0A9X6RNP6_HYPEX|nr:hypothetical protein BV898_19002 [Hypsibius exemplaris]